MLLVLKMEEGHKEQEDSSRRIAGEDEETDSFLKQHVATNSAELQ